MTILKKKTLYKNIYIFFVIGKKIILLFWKKKYPLINTFLITNESLKKIEIRSKLRHPSFYSNNKNIIQLS
jgi:hypothetical protein